MPFNMGFQIIAYAPMEGGFRSLKRMGSEARICLSCITSRDIRLYLMGITTENTRINTNDGVPLAKAEKKLI